MIPKLSTFSFSIFACILIFQLNSCFQNETLVVNTPIAQDITITPEVAKEQSDDIICSYSSKENPKAKGIEIKLATLVRGRLKTAKLTI